MTGLRNANVALRFLLELAVLVALGYWGFSTHEVLWQKVLFGIGAPLLAAVVWGLFVAPKARFAVSLPWRLLIEAVVFGAGVAALVAAGRPELGWAFLVIVVINAVLLLALRE